MVNQKPLWREQLIIGMIVMAPMLFFAFVFMALFP